MDGAATTIPVNPLTDPSFVAGLRTVSSSVDGDPTAWPASDLSGFDPDGTPVGFEFDTAGQPVLLVFLSTNCDGCDLYWRLLQDEPPKDVAVVVVTKGPETVSSEEVKALSSGLVASVVMTDAAWSDFHVTSYPFLIVVEPSTRRIIGERVGFGRSDVESLVELISGR